jgi:hypothetical protein
VEASKEGKPSRDPLLGLLILFFPGSGLLVFGVLFVFLGFLHQNPFFPRDQGGGRRFEPQVRKFFFFGGEDGKRRSQSKFGIDDPEGDVGLREGLKSEEAWRGHKRGAITYHCFGYVGRRKGEEDGGGRKREKEGEGGRRREGEGGRRRRREREGEGGRRRRREREKEGEGGRRRDKEGEGRGRGGWREEAEAD